MPSDLLSTLSRPIGATPDRLFPNAFVVPKNQASRSEYEFFRFSGNRLPDCVVLFLGTDGNAAHPLPVAHNVLVSDRPRSMAARPDPGDRGDKPVRGFSSPSSSYHLLLNVVRYACVD
jgi:hypothetical protein